MTHALTKTGQTVEWREIVLRSLPALTAVAATVYVLDNPGLPALSLQILSGVFTLAAWLPRR